MYLYSKTKFCTLYNMVCCNQIHLNHSLDGLRFMCPFLSTKYVFIPTCHLLYLKRESTFCCFQIRNCWLDVARKRQKWQELARVQRSVHHSKWPPPCTVNYTTTKSSFTLEIFWLYTWYAKLNFCLFRIWINVFLVVQYHKMIWVSKGPVHDCSCCCCCCCCCCCSIHHCWHLASA